MRKKKAIHIILVLFFCIALGSIVAMEWFSFDETEDEDPSNPADQDQPLQTASRSEIPDHVHYLHKFYSREELKKLVPENGITTEELVKKIGQPSSQLVTDRNFGEIWTYQYDRETADSNPYKSAYIGFFIDNGRVNGWCIDNRNMYAKPRTKKELDKLLKVGMTREQVYRILGEPCNAESFSSTDFYRYRKEDCFIENGLLHDCFNLFYLDGKLEVWGTGHVYSQEYLDSIGLKPRILPDQPEERGAGDRQPLPQPGETLTRRKIN